MYFFNKTIWKTYVDSEIKAAANIKTRIYKLFENVDKLCDSFWQKAAEGVELLFLFKCVFVLFTSASSA